MQDYINIDRAFEVWLLWPNRRVSHGMQIVDDDYIRL